MYTEISDVPAREILPGYHARFLHGEGYTLAFWDVEAGAVLPEHAHVHEQAAQVLEGRFELVVEGETFVCGPGAVVRILSNARHSGLALTDCKLMDVFTPVREDYK